MKKPVKVAVIYHSATANGAGALAAARYQGQRLARVAQALTSLR